MVFNQITSELNLCDSQTQSLASCELLVWNFFQVFPHFKRVPFKRRYCSIFKVPCAAPFRVGSSFIISHQVAFVKHFFEIFLSRSFKRRPPRGVPDYNTTTPPRCQHLFSSFFLFFLFFQFRRVFRPAARVLYALIYYSIMRKSESRFHPQNFKKHLPSAQICAIILSAPINGVYASVAQLDRAFGSDNSDRQLSSAEKPHNKAIFRHRVLRFCSSLTTI